MAWTIKLLDERVKRELMALPEDMQAYYGKTCELLTQHGPAEVGMPHVRHVEGGLWEMRLKGKGGIARSLYVLVVNEVILVLRVFVKKTQQTPRSEIDLALQRLKEWRKK